MRTMVARTPMASAFIPRPPIRRYFDRPVAILGAAITGTQVTKDPYAEWAAAADRERMARIADEDQHDSVMAVLLAFRPTVP